MKFFIVILMFSCSILLADDYSKPKAKNINQGNFINEIQSDDPEVQSRIDQLKEDFHNQKDQVNDKYDIKKKTLKKQKQQEMEQLKKAFRKKMKRLRDKYPKKIKSNKKKNPKPVRKYTKPLEKKKNRHEDPRKSGTNSLEKIEKPSKKLCGLDCIKSCCANPTSKKKKKPLKKNK